MISNTLPQELLIIIADFHHWKCDVCQKYFKNKHIHCTNSLCKTKNIVDEPQNDSDLEKSRYQHELCHICWFLGFCDDIIDEEDIFIYEMLNDFSDF